MGVREVQTHVLTFKVLKFHLKIKALSYLFYFCVCVFEVYISFYAFLYNYTQFTSNLTNVGAPENIYWSDPLNNDTIT